MKKRIGAVIASVALLLVAVLSAWAGITHTKIPKQNELGGDSLGTGPDTSDAMQLYSLGTAFTVEIAVLDTAATYMVQLSPPEDGSNWFNWAVLDTVDSGFVYQTDDLGTKYRSWWIRIILDNLGASEQTYGRAFVTWEY